MKLLWATAKNEQKAKFVLVGVPDETGLLDFKYKGTKDAPGAIRRASHRFEKFVYNKIVSRAEAEDAEIQSNLVFDAGTVSKKKLARTVELLVRKKKIPIILGGDHSITTEALRGVNQALLAGKGRAISLLYLDSHPDFICSIKRYHGSVLCEVRQFKSINFRRSIEIGIRQPEREELHNISKYGLTVFPAYLFAEQSLETIVKKIRSKIGKNKIYLSIDMDVLDPAFAPGVSTPVPGGLTSNQLISFIRKLPLSRLVGIDIMEVNPRRDQNGMTADLACRLLAEVLPHRRTS